MTLAEEDALSEVADIGAFIDNDIEKALAIVDNSNSTVWQHIDIFWPQLGLRVVITCYSCTNKNTRARCAFGNMVEYLNIS